MNELVWDLAPRYVPTKFDRNRRRIAPGRALTGLSLQTDRRTISFQYTPLSTSLSGGIKIDYCKSMYFDTAQILILDKEQKVLSILHNKFHGCWPGNKMSQSIISHNKNLVLVHSPAPAPTHFITFINIDLIQVTYCIRYLHKNWFR